MPTITANGIRIYYERHGHGAPLVLIGGLGYGLWQWHRMVPLLAQAHEVIVFDNRGAGQTDKPDGPYNVQMLGDDTAGLLDALGLTGVTLLGHSMGGFVAQQVALARPDLVGRLILAATNYGGPNHVPVTPEALQILMDRSGDPLMLVRRGISVATAPGFIEAHPDLVEALIAYRLSAPVPPAAYQAQLAVGLGLLAAPAAFDWRLHRVTVPALILFGAHDRVVPPANAALLAAVLPDSSVMILPDCGHMFPIEQPAAAAAAITAWLEGPG